MNYLCLECSQRDREDGDDCRCQPANQFIYSCKWKDWTDGERKITIIHQSLSIGWPDDWHADDWHADDWHADNWHGRQLACGKLAWRTIGIDFFNCLLLNYFNVLTNNKFHFQIKNLWTMLPHKQSYFRMTDENKFCYRIIYRIIFE